MSEDFLTKGELMREAGEVTQPLVKFVAKLDAIYGVNHVAVVDDSGFWIGLHEDVEWKKKPIQKIYPSNELSSH